METNNNALTLYGRMPDPLAAIKTLGEAFKTSPMLGLTTPGDGIVLAMTCMADGITPLDFIRKYHIIEGRPSMRADAMTAEFRRRGGKVRWLQLGDSGTAEAEFEFENQTLKMSFTLDDARRLLGKGKDGKDRIDKPGGNWEKDPGAMLRARLTSKAIRILAPEIVAGVYTPEEVQDFADDVAVKPAAARKAVADRRQAEVAEAVAAVAPNKPTPEQMAQIEAAWNATPNAPAPGEVIDAEFEPKPQTTPEPTPAPPVAEVPNAIDDPEALATNEDFRTLLAVASKLQSPTDPSRGYNAEEVLTGLKKACNVTDHRQAKRRQVLALIGKFRERLSRGPQ
jgi:hypothetical protein